MVTVAKVFDALHDEDDSLGEEILDFGIASAAGHVANKITDELLDDESDDNDFYTDSEY